MTMNEVGKIITRLTNAFLYNRFDDPGVTEEYQRFLVKHNFQVMNTAIDIAIENDSKNVPPISALIKACRESNKPGVVEVKNLEYCAICDNKGYVIMTEIESKLDDNPYQYVLHCACLVGKSKQYDGKNCKKGEQSPYKVPCVTEYFDDYAIEQMEKSNKQKYKMTAETKMEIKSQLAKFGIKMPELKPHETEHGDAWEGVLNCPF